MSAIVDHDYDQGLDVPRATANWNKVATETTSNKATSPDFDKEQLHINTKTETANKSERQVAEIAREKAEIEGQPGSTSTSNLKMTTIAPASSSQAVPPIGVQQTTTTSKTTTITTSSDDSVAPSPPSFHHSVDEVPQVLDRLDDSLPPAVPSVDEIQTTVQNNVSSAVNNVTARLPSKEQVTDAVNNVAARLPSKEQVQETVTRVREEAPAQINTYWARGKLFLEQFFSHSEDEDEDNEEYDDESDDDTITTTTETTVTVEEKDPQHMTPLEKEAYAYKLSALEARQKSLVLGERINEKQRELDAARDSQSTVNQIKESVSGAVSTLNDQLSSTMENVRAGVNVAGSKLREGYYVAGSKVREGYNQAAAVVDSNVHQALGVREGEPITADTLLSQSRIQQAAQKLTEPVPVVVQGTLTTVENIQAFLMTYIRSYQAFYLAVRQQSMPMQIAYAILLTTHLACPLLFLDKPAARTVLASTLLVIFASHLTYFLTNHLKFLFLSHCLFAEMIFVLIFSAGWTWEQNVNSVLNMPFYELPLHPILLRAYFYGVWVRIACMTTAMLLTLDSITINALYQRYLIRVAQQQQRTTSGSSSSRRSGKRISSGNNHMTGRKRKEHALREQLRNKSLRGQIDSNISTINAGSNRPQAAGSSLSRNAPELGELSTSKYNESLAHNLNASALNQVPASSAASGPQQKWVKKEEQTTYNNNRDMDDNSSSVVKLESHEKPMEGLRERKRPTTDYSSSTTTVSSA